MSLTGYGPIAKNLSFDGENSNYELFEIKFLSYLRMQKLYSVVMDDNDVLMTSEIATTDTDAIEKNKMVFACLVQFLDDKSISIILRDAKNNGRKALQVLRNHYLGASKPRIISMYHELTTLKLENSETVTDFLLRGETTSTRLNEAGEKVSDALLISMILKGLPDSFKSFSSVILQQDIDNMSFSKFKNALKNYEEN